MITFLFATLANFWRVYVITVLWAWFVVPHYGVAPLAFWLAYALSNIYSLVILKPISIADWTTAAQAYKSKDFETMRKTCVCANLGTFAIAPLLALLIGWILLKCGV